MADKKVTMTESGIRRMIKKISESKNSGDSGNTDSTLDINSKNAISNSAVTAAIDEINNRLYYAEYDRTEYGIRWMHGASDSQCERVTRLNGMIKVGDDTGLFFNINPDGSFVSSYDKIYPWSEMRRTTIKGQIMVQIPKYYILIETVDEYDYIWVCRYKVNDNYRCAATHLNTSGAELNYYYVGAYECTVHSIGKSLPGMSEYDNAIAENEPRPTLTEYRNAAMALGDGWGITTIAEVCDIWQVLLPIEFGTRNVASVVAGMFFGLDWDLYEDVFITGQTDNVTHLHGISYLSDGNNRLTLFRDQYLSGFNCGLNPFVYRGVENLYGHGGKWIDGLIVTGSVIYVTNDRTAFKTTAGKQAVSNKMAISNRLKGYVYELESVDGAPYCRLAHALKIGDVESHYCAYTGDLRASSTDRTKNFWTYFGEGPNDTAAIDAYPSVWDIRTYTTPEESIRTNKGPSWINARLSYSPVE